MNPISAGPWHLLPLDSFRIPLPCSSSCCLSPLSTFTSPLSPVASVRTVPDSREGPWDTCNVSHHVFVADYVLVGDRTMLTSDTTLEINAPSVPAYAYVGSEQDTKWAMSIAGGFQRPQHQASRLGIPLTQFHCHGVYTAESHKFIDPQRLSDIDL
jgi:hypothetical protein